ncbi:hypothetical protein SAMN05421770_106257 [Granulicella rosea]|uniref:MoaD/ThiS family protein n=1 Tax=Granulicella rosea TaxID=474952 RepID=A0A239LCN6_9BACT|nr:MoaD/ThiS family protein [Granulicella rosea]SNT27613.1 hypothetical protein SAMN05421770_106257 [Granulicella rosea]
MIRVQLPGHLRLLAGVTGEIAFELEAPATQRSLLDAVELRYPMLQGTIRDYRTGQRRGFLRFFACEQDLSHADPDAPLPPAVADGREPYLIVASVAGG